MNNIPEEPTPQPLPERHQELTETSPPPTIQRPQVDTGKLIEKSQSGNNHNKKVEK